jgi:hypothetical protein
MFIKSLFPYEVEICGILIPKRLYSSREASLGKRSFVEVSEEQLEELNNDGVFKCHIETGKYIVCDSIPSDLLSSSDKLKQVEIKNIEQLSEIQKLKIENEILLKENTTLKGL